MKLDNIKHSAQRLNTLVDGWQTNGEIPRIERDMALEELRRLYDQLLDIDLSKPEAAEVTASAPVVAPVVVAVAEEPAEQTAPEVEDIETAAPIAEPVVAEVAEPEPVEASEEEDLIDIDALLGLSSVAVATTAAAAATAADATAGVVSNIAPSDSESTELTSADEVSADATEPVDVLADEDATDSLNTIEEAPATNGELFAMEDIPVSRGNGRKIISIYNTAGMAAATAAAATTTAADAYSAPQAPVEEQPKRLADVLAGEKRVLAEKIASEEKPTTPFNRITDLRKAIGINDKFLMIKDLFGGDAVRYEATIDTLNEFEDLDDCMIYIVENFSWNPDSEGAKLLVSLIERKLS